MAAGTDGTPEPGPEAGVDELQADIERTRAELTDTVGALSDKLDVKGRAQQKVAETKESVGHSTHELAAKAKARPVVPAGVVVGALAVVGLVIWWRRR